VGPDSELTVVRLEVISRQLVLASLVAALIAGRAFMRPETKWAMAAAFLIVAVLSFISTRAAAALALGTALVTPALVLAGLGFYYGPEAFVWPAALAALVCARSWREPWAIPLPMRWPLVSWALVVALTWPIVLFREANFSPALMGADGRFAGAVWIAANWIAAVAITHMLGILWFDWLFREFDGRQHAFVRIVAWPLTVSWLLTVALGIYQATVNIGFVNGGAHLALGRASGGLMDANPYGVAVALWGPIVYVLCVSLEIPLAQPLGMAALALSWYGMWVSGSRGAFGAALVGLMAVVAAETGVGDPRRRRWTFAMLAAGVALTALAAYILPMENSPIRRLAPLFRGITDVPLTAFVAERWDPYFYGRTAWRALEDSPLFGIGLGSFQSVVNPYSRLLGHPPLVADNAQNWFRHQLTELGALGSIGWAFWVICAVILILSPAADRRAARIGKGGLLACAAVSLIGMPGQHIAIVVIFWTFAFVVVQQVVPRWPVALQSVTRLRTAWVVLAVLCAIGTAEAGWRALTPARRAARFGDYYAFGVTGFTDANGSGELTMHGRRAIAVVHPTSRFLKLSVVRTAPGSPADVTIAVSRRALVSGSLSDTERVQFMTLRDVSESVVVDGASAVDLPAPDGVRIRWAFLPGPE
jgi:hypothetical protein